MMLAVFILAHGVTLGCSIFQQLGIIDVPIAGIASKFSLQGIDAFPHNVLKLEEPNQLDLSVALQNDLTQKLYVVLAESPVRLAVVIPAPTVPDGVVAAVGGVLLVLI